MALVDGECSAPERLVLEARTAADPELARRYARQRGLRDRLRAYYDAVQHEPVPQRLLDAALATQPRHVRPTWLAIAASLAGGIFLGALMFRLISVTPGVTAPGAFQKVELMADGELGQALSRQLASDPASHPVRIGVSFLSKTGRYCRTFVDGRGREPVAGLACRDVDTWRLKVLEPGTRTGTSGYVQAETPLSATIVQAAETLMNGDPLDAAGEAAARATGWKAVPITP